MGTAAFALPFLNKIVDSGYNVVGVVTQPDRPNGRGRKMVLTPVKQLALERNIPVFQPTRIKESGAVDTVLAWQPDLIIVVAYGQIIPVELLESPPFGCVNVHPSLLPLYRGPAPVQRAIMSGDKVTGITTMFMDKGLDTGDIILQVPVEIDEAIDSGQLFDILAEKGSDLLLETIESISTGKVKRIKQRDDLSTYAPLITREDENINWSESALNLNNRIRALSPSPGTFSSISDSRFKIFSSRVIEETSVGKPGQVLELTEKGFVVQTGKGTLEILEVQKEGKRRMVCREFLKGFPVLPGSRLGT
jgi:methionyl-tRNA formyltransferase